MLNSILMVLYSLQGPVPSVGGIIRDTNGVWQCGFSMTIGDGTIFQVEVRAMLERLRLAWNKGF
ncbi:hypothetical protein Golax_014833 [Gossypium laxum]|uniref:RNase H type-1 domain-containing protein n=1 Tax=Gossypium laxum TaxID=34288 RepID=A0A7J8ZWF9_9ROSI|nr:hypothetical protein [Gossypium laxum]